MMHIPAHKQTLSLQSSREKDVERQADIKTWLDTLEDAVSRNEKAESQGLPQPMNRILYNDALHLLKRYGRR